MSNEFRIATWNLERPKLKGWSRNPCISKKVQEVSADLWILTETNACIVPGDDHFSEATLPIPGYHSAGECFTAIWTRWRLLRRISTFDPDLALCVEVDSPFGPMIVYGTIITYAHDPGPNKKSKRWVEHKKSIRQHAVDWQNIRSNFPNHHFLVAGDFNQSRDSSGWYEDGEAVQLLTEALQQSSLECVTGMDMRKAGMLSTRASIDHICLSKSLAERVASVDAWEGCTADGAKMSDHNGVSIVLKT